MAALVGYVAFGFPSGGEFLVLLVLGVMLFGRRLPEVARKVGHTAGQLRRSYENFKREMAADESLREVRDDVRGLKRVADAPKRLRDPKRLFEDLTDERRSTPASAARSPAPPSPGANVSDA